jgi:NADH dehydrogenase [ubiquinone] 1 alpha subcomplex assembly factor 7
MIGGSPKAPRPASAPAAGAALILDYGPSETIPTNSLRGIKAHKQVSPFYAPGAVDLSADVDFGGLVEAALNASEQIEVHGPVDQSFFLLSMGIEQRVQALKDQNKDSKTFDVEIIEQAWRRLVDRGVNGMGRLYKALAIVPSRGGKRPIGFGGDLTAEDVREKK